MGEIGILVAEGSYSRSFGLSNLLEFGAGGGRGAPSFEDLSLFLNSYSNDWLISELREDWRADYPDSPDSES